MEVIYYRPDGRAVIKVLSSVREHGTNNISIRISRDSVDCSGEATDDCNIHRSIMQSSDLSLVELDQDHIINLA